MYLENEVWKDIPHYEGRYLISNYGRVFSLLTKKMLAVFINTNGYNQIRLINENGRRKTETVHRLVALAFIPNPDKLPEVNHINCIRTDNRVENLEWCSHKQNQEWKWATSDQTKIRETSRQLMLKLNDEKYPNREVVCLDTGEVFSSTYEAEKKNGGFATNINKVCNGERHTCNGYRYEWLNK